MGIEILAVCVMIFLVFVAVHLHNAYLYNKALIEIRKMVLKEKWEVVNSTLVNLKFENVEALEKKLREDKRRFV